MSSEPHIFTPTHFESFDKSKLRSCGIASLLFSTEHAPLDDSPAFFDGPSGTQLTRKQVYENSLKLGFGVKKRYGLGKGKGVAMVFSPNSLAWPIVFMGLQAQGVRTTLANSSYTPPELAHQIRDSGASIFFVHPLLLPTLLKTLKTLKISEKDAARKKVVLMSFVEQDRKDEKTVLAKIEKETGIRSAEWTRLKDMLSQGSLQEIVKFEGAAANETALLCYSSGTTGLSKGVESTHKNVVTIPQIFLPAWEAFDREKDRAIGVLPFFHIFGIVKVLIFNFWIGAPTVILPKFEPVLFLTAIEKYRISFMKIVPPILVLLASHPVVKQHDISSLKFIMCGAAPLGEGLVKRVQARLIDAGCSKNIVITQGYGLTETSPTTHFLPKDYFLTKVGSIGTLLPSLECRLVDDDGKDISEERAVETAGEIWIRGSNVMKGYLNNPSATENSITKDGWFQTGDMALRDRDGFYRIVDRKKELIKYKGFQVPPADLEAVLLTKEDIADVGVIGVEDKDQATELPRAYVVSTNNAALLKDDKARAEFEKNVEEWIKTKVAKHKFLRGGVKVIEAVPKSATGKILRRQLRELAKQEATGETKAKL